MSLSISFPAIQMLRAGMRGPLLPAGRPLAALPQLPPRGGAAGVAQLVGPHRLHRADREEDGPRAGRRLPPPGAPALGSSAARAGLLLQGRPRARCSDPMIVPGTQHEEYEKKIARRTNDLWPSSWSVQTT